MTEVGKFSTLRYSSLALQGVVNRKLQLIGGRNSKNGSGMEPIILDSAGSSKAPFAIILGDSRAEVWRKYETERICAWMDSIIAYQIKREFAGKIKFFKTFCSPLQNVRLVKNSMFVSTRYLKFFIRLISSIFFNGNVFSRMEKYSDLRTKDRFLSILTFLIRISLLTGKTVLTRFSINFPVNLKLNRKREDRISRQFFNSPLFLHTARIVWWNLIRFRSAAISRTKAAGKGRTKARSNRISNSIIAAERFLDYRFSRI